jgi:oligopeptide transport system substrate-binding protein
MSLPKFAALSVLAALFLSWHGAGYAETVLRRGNGAEAGSLDPQLIGSTSQDNVGRDLFEGLTAYGPGGRVVAGQAESWTVSSDGKVWTFHLRPGLKWSNGDPLTAEDFVYSFRRLVDPVTGAPAAELAQPILNAAAIRKGEEKDLTKLGVTAPDPQTVEITLADPNPSLPQMLSLLRPSNRASVEALGPEAFHPAKLVSNGAYRLVAWRPQAAIVIEKNQNYWDAAHVRIDRVEFYPIEDRAEELKRYRAGGLDVTFGVPPDQIDFVRQTLGAELKQSPALGTFAIGFNTTRPPFKDNLKLREALTLALDRRVLADKVVHGLFAPADGLVPSTIEGYPNAAFPGAELSQAAREELARKLYAEAGYSREKPAKFGLLYVTADTTKEIMIAVVGMWNRVLGVSVDLENTDFKTSIVRRKARQTEAFQGGLIAPYVDPWFLLDQYETTGWFNDTGYANPKFDALLDQATHTAELTQRMALFGRAEAAALADFPVAPVFYRAASHLIKPYVAGWQPSPCDSYRSQDLSISLH